MYSLNAPVPPEVARLASSLATELHADRARTRHTLVVKRLGDDPRSRIAAEARDALAGAPACEARVLGVDTFENPTTGTGPVVYLVVESPGLFAIHGRLLEAFDPVPDIEGDDYVPHVTIARGGDRDVLRDLLERNFERTWTVDRLELWDANYRETVESISLPA